jgi:hypothetical protein
MLIPTPGQSWVWLVKSVFPFLLAGIWMWAPRTYRIEGDALIVQRRVGGVRIPLRGLHHVRLMNPDELRGAIRIWAVGACFGYFGRFLNGVESQTW